MGVRFDGEKRETRNEGVGVRWESGRMEGLKNARKILY